MYKAYITKIKEVRPHSNADRLQCVSCFGNNVVVGLDTKVGDLGVYFGADGRLGEEYAELNNLVRKKDDNGNSIGGYLDPDKRKVSTIKLRGEESDGLFMPIESLSRFCDISKLKEGDTIDVLNGVVICEKYVPRGSSVPKFAKGKTSKSKKSEIDKYPIFFEHKHTSQLCYNHHVFSEGDLCYITLKMHGTSQRTSLTVKERVDKRPKWLKRIFKKPNEKSWENMCGTRRVVLKGFDKEGFYGNNDFRKQHHDKFVGKLQKGESVFYEVVGYMGEDKPIMSDCANSKLKDKDFVKKYGDTTRFSYGCEQGESEMYVYRMTMTNEDGFVVEYPWEQVKRRCEQMAVNCVPEFDKFFFTTIEDLMDRVERYCDGIDPIGKNHIREGVVVRIDSKDGFSAYKHKNFSFKILENIIKVEAMAPDIEEEQDLFEENS